MKNVFKLSTMLIVMAGLVYVSSSCKKEEEVPNPDVSFDVEGNYQQAPASVRFIDQTENIDGGTYLWDFQDGTTSTETNPTHEYTEGGSYYVELTVTNKEGEAYSAKNMVNVYNTIIGWKPSSIRLYPGCWANESHRFNAYLVLRDSNGSIYDYTGEQTFTTYSDIDTTTYDLSFYIHGNMCTNLDNGKITCELREYNGGDYVSPNTDRIVFSQVVRSSDIVPAEENGQFKSFYYAYDNEFKMDIDWIEAE